MACNLGWSWNLHKIIMSSGPIFKPFVSLRNCIGPPSWEGGACLLRCLCSILCPLSRTFHLERVTMNLENTKSYVGHYLWCCLATCCSGVSTPFSWPTFKVFVDFSFPDTQEQNFIQSESEPPHCPAGDLAMWWDLRTVLNLGKVRLLLENFYPECHFPLGLIWYIVEGMSTDPMSSVFTSVQDTSDCCF